MWNKKMNFIFSCQLTWSRYRARSIKSTCVATAPHRSPWIMWCGHGNLTETSTEAKVVITIRMSVSIDGVRTWRRFSALSALCEGTNNPVIGTWCSCNVTAMYSLQLVETIVYKIGQHSADDNSQIILRKSFPFYIKFPNVCHRVPAIVQLMTWRNGDKLLPGPIQWGICSTRHFKGLLSECITQCAMMRRWQSSPLAQAAQYRSMTLN